MRGVKVFSGRSHPALTKAICERLGTAPGKCDLGSFSNGEISVQIGTSVRNEDIFIVQSGSPKINDSIMEMLIMIAACKGGSAKSITAVVPYFPYSRQSKKKSHRGPITAKMLANLMVVAGVTHIITVDLHSSLMQGFFGKPVDNLEAQPLLARWVKTNVRNWKDAVVVSKNVGGTKRVTAFADLLKIRFAIISTDRDRSRHPQYISNMNDSTVFFDAIGPQSIHTQQRESDHDEGEDADNESENRSCNVKPTTPTKPQVNGIASRPKSVTIASSPTVHATTAASPDTSSPHHQSRVETVPNARRPSEYEANDGAFDERARDVIIGRLIQGHVVDEDHPSPALSNASAFGQWIPSASLLPEAIDDSDHNPMTLSFMSNASSFHPDHALGGTIDAAATSDEEEEVMKNSEVEHTVTLVGDVKNRTVLIVDDIMDRSASWVASAETCVKRGMAKKVYCIAIHALFGDDSLEELEACDCIDHIIVTNTFPISAEKIKSSRKLVVIELSNLLSEAIRRNHHGESVRAFED
ncbi:hypothetical protein DV736_g3521, partial [Chaetothyriales sp. CBS 134916]